MAKVATNAKFDRREIMNKAWGLMRSKYSHGAISFLSIGRRCLAWCIKEAWRQAHEAAKVAALTVGDLAARIAAVKARMENARYSDSFGQWAAEERAAQAELDCLTATARAAGLPLAA
jgi:hypothetical protein